MSEKFSFMACTGRYRARGTLGRSGQDRALVVELDHLDRSPRRRVEAQPAQHALVEALLHDLKPAAVLLGKDVDRARLRHPARQLRIGGDRVVHLDRDEHRVRSHAGARSAIFARIIPGMSSIRSATAMPAWARRAIFSAAVSWIPSTIVPAWPKLMPGISSMNLPAMNATIGRRDSFSTTQRASSASMRPPGSV